MKLDQGKIHQKNILAITEALLNGAILSIPRPVELSITFFKQGGGNYLYRINADDKIYLARVNFYPLKNQWRIKENEYTCLKMLEPLNIAPKPYFIDADGKYLEQHFIIVDYIEAETLQYLNDEIIQSLASTLLKLHTSITFDRPGNSIPPDDGLPYVCGVYGEFAEGEDKQIEKYHNLSNISEIIEPFNRVKQKLAQWFGQQTCFADCVVFSLCHADLKQENILRTSVGVKLIDWECAGSDIPETDIGRLFSGCQFSREQEELFLSNYYSGSVSKISRERINAIRTVLDFFHILEDYILLKRKEWNAAAMKQELERFEDRVTL